MAPKEKAEELCTKMFNSQHFEPCSWKEAKQCALIAVDEIVKNIIYSFEDNRYWEEVKQEIEKI